MLRTAGDEAKQQAWLGVSKKTALKSPAMYLACAATFLTGIYAAGVCNHVVTYLCIDNWEITAAAGVMTVFTLFGVVGNSCGGALIGKVGTKKGILIGVVALIIAMACLTMANKVAPLAYVWAEFQGLASFVAILVPSLIVTETFGTKEYAGIYGIVYAAYLVGCAVSTPVIAFIAESISYTVAWIVVCAVVAVMALLHVRCSAYGKKFRAQYPD